MSLQQIFDHLDANMSTYKTRLSDAVAIPSVSNSQETEHVEATRSVLEDFTRPLLEGIGATIDMREIGDNQEYPPVIFATLGTSASKKTVLVYGHMDVQPAQMSDGWDTEPFTMTTIDGKMYGRGTTDDKGPVLAWINAIEAYQQLSIPLPVNIKFVLEGMEESGDSGPLQDLILSEADGFFAGIDYTCISDNYWLGQNTPCITYGLRGIVYFHVNVKCAKKDLHSGVHGGVVYEGMAELCAILNSMVAPNGDITITGINRDVLPMTPEEEASYGPIDFNIDTYKSELGVTKLTQITKAGILQHRWRYPSLSIHGIEGAFSDAGDKTVIPAEITGKFSIRLVPDMDPQKVTNLVKAHIRSVHNSTGSENEVTVSTTASAFSWLGDTSDANYTAGKRATVRVHRKAADLTREGGSIPITLTLQEATGKSVMMLPIGSSDDGAHSQNEKLNVTNYLSGMKLLASYMYEVSQLAAGR